MTIRAAPGTVARIAGVLYLGTYLAGLVALIGGKVVAGFIASACYVGVTLAFYYLFTPVSRPLSLLAALVSLLGSIVGALDAAHLIVSPINSLAFFGFYCVLIGYLIFRSAFLPRFLGVLMALGGLSWLTFLSPSLAHALAPYNYGPGLLAEGVLTLWLLVRGVAPASSHP